MKILYSGQVPSKSNFRRSGKNWRERWRRIKTFEEVLGWLAKGQGAKLSLEPIAITVVFYNQKIDADNGLKSIGDALEGVCYENDKQVKTWSVGEVQDGKGARLSVLVSEIKEEA